MTNGNGGYHSLLEERMLRDLRPRFEALGYVFVEHPRPEDLPAFMAGWIPDAIATRGSRGIAIEVVGRHLLYGERLLETRSRFAGQENWRLTIVSDAKDVVAHLFVSTPTVERIRTAAAAIEDLVERGHLPAGLVMAFALLETTSRIVAGEETGVAREPGTVVQALAMEGLIDRTTDEKLRQLIQARNRVVHGSLDEQIDPASIRLILAAVETALTTAFAA